MPLIVWRGQVMGKDCGWGNEQLGGKALAANAKGKREGRKFLESYWLGIFFFFEMPKIEAAGSSRDIARENLA